MNYLIQNPNQCIIIYFIFSQFLSLIINPFIFIGFINFIDLINLNLYIFSFIKLYFILFIIIFQYQLFI